MVNQKTSVLTGNINSNGGNISIGNQQYITNIFHSSEWKKMEEEKEKLEKDIKFCESLLLKEGNCDDEGIIKRLSEAKNDLKNKLKEMEDFKHGILQLAETFSKIEIDSERLQEVYKLFLEGEYSEARTILMMEQALNEHEDLLKKREKLSQDIEENEKKLKQKAKESFLLANLQAVNYSIGASRVDEASKYFQLALREHKCFEYLISYATFLRHNNRRLDAEKICQKTISFIKENYKETDEEKQNLAEILTEYVQVLIVFPDRLSLAEEKAREALEIYSSFKIIPKKLISTLVKVLNELGNVLDELGKYQDAERFYKSGLEILDNYKYKDPILFAKILHDYAILLSKNEQKFNQAEKFLCKTLKIRSSISYTDNSVKIIEISRALLSLGNLLSKQNSRYKEARDCYGAVLANLAKLIERGYYEFSFWEALCLGNLARLLNDMAQVDISLYPEAERNYILAIEKYKKIREIEPGAYTHHISRLLRNYGTLLDEIGKAQEAENKFLEAIQILEFIEGEENFEVFDDIVLVKANLAKLYEKYNKYDKFEELCIDILEKRILLFANNPKFYERSLKKTINYINSFLQAHKIENDKLFDMCVNASTLLAKYEQKIKRRKLYY
jgi:hypothetical protein